MRPTIRVSIAVVLLCVSISALGQADRLIPMSPCRLLDTRFMPPASAAEQRARTIDIAPTRCGTIIPGLATAYAIRVTRRSEEHTSELQSRLHLVCRLLLEKK